MPVASRLLWTALWEGMATMALVGVLVFGSWFNHYGLPLIPPLAACAAGFFAAHRRFALGLLVIVFVGGQVTLIAKRFERGTPGLDRRRRLWDRARSDRQDQMVEIDRILTRRPEWVVMRKKPYRRELPDVCARMQAVLPMGKERYALWWRVTPTARSAINPE